MIIESCVEHITDPRRRKNQVYPLSSLMLIIFASVISGYDAVESMVEFAKHKLDWLRKFVELPSVPSAETLRYLLCAINPNELTKCFSSFMESNEIDTEGDCIAIDGKTMRGTRSRNQDALHMISAWSNQHGITLAMLESKGKKNEIKTIPEVVDILEPTGAIITIDAMGCQKKIAAKIVEKKGDYALQLKGNQGVLFEEIKAYHHMLVRTEFNGVEHDSFEEVEKGHGRIEIRKYTQFQVTDWVEAKVDWKQLNTVIRVERTRDINGAVQEETSWYISSLKVDAKQAGKAVRAHWGVENSLHWRLDVIFKDDQCALHSGSGPLNMTIIKRYCMNLLSKDTTVKRMKNRVMVASIDDSFREKVLFG